MSCRSGSSVCGVSAASVTVSSAGPMGGWKGGEALTTLFPNVVSFFFCLFFFF